MAIGTAADNNNHFNSTADKRNEKKTIKIEFYSKLEHPLLANGKMYIFFSCPDLFLPDFIHYELLMKFSFFFFFIFAESVFFLFYRCCSYAYGRANVYEWANEHVTLNA